MANSEFSTENVRAANPCLLKVNNLNTNVNRYKHLMDEEDFFF